MTWAQWDDLIRCAEVFQANDTPLDPKESDAILDRNQLNSAEQELWDDYLFKNG
jgi:hypothetical protein